MFIDCEYTTFGDKQVVKKPGKTIKIHHEPLGSAHESLQKCKAFCNENPECRSFNHCAGTGECDLQNRVLRESEDSKFDLQCTTHYKPCGK